MYKISTAYSYRDAHLYYYYYYLLYRRRKKNLKKIYSYARLGLKIYTWKKKKECTGRQTLRRDPSHARACPWAHSIIIACVDLGLGVKPYRPTEHKLNETHDRGRERKKKKKQTFYGDQVGPVRGKSYYILLMTNKIEIVFLYRSSPSSRASNYVFII